MAKLEIYRDLDSVPQTTEIAVAPGRQLYIGSKLKDALEQPYGLSAMSTLNVLAGAMVAEATDSELFITGNKKKFYPQGAVRLLDERFPGVHYSTDPEDADDAVSTLGSAKSLAPKLKTIIKNGIAEVVVTSDEQQGFRLACLFMDQGVAIRGIAIAHRVVMDSPLPKDRALGLAYEQGGWKKTLENGKQGIIDRIDPHATRIEGIVQRLRR